MILKESGLAGAAEIAIELTYRPRFFVAPVDLSVVSTDVCVTRGVIVTVLYPLRTL